MKGSYKFMVPSCGCIVDGLSQIPSIAPGGKEARGDLLALFVVIIYEELNMLVEGA